MLSVFTTHTRKKKGHKEIFGSDGYFYHLNCDDGIWMYTYIQIHQIIYIKMCSFCTQSIPLCAGKKLKVAKTFLYVFL